MDEVCIGFLMAVRSSQSVPDNKIEKKGATNYMV
jgi:hypothetical protein